MTRSAQRRSWGAFALLWCLASALGSPLLAAGRAPEGPTPQTVLREATQMLAAGLSSDFVLEWLEGSAVPPARPTAEQAIALRKAGATDALLRRMLEMATEEVAAQELASAGEAQGAPPPGAAGRPFQGEGVAVAFELAYVPRFDPGEATWDLYLYLDGRPLSYVPAAGASALQEMAEPLIFERELAPGEHFLLVALERHGRRGRGAWHHQAKAVPEAFRFELNRGEEAWVSVAYEQGLEELLGGRGPVSFAMEQAGRTGSLADVGGDPAEWMEICEDLESEVQDLKEKKREQRLAGCAPWASLWPEGVAPSRAAVWEALAAFDFRPLPQESSAPQRRNGV